MAEEKAQAFHERRCGDDDLRRFVRDFPWPILLLDADGKISFVNEAFSLYRPQSRVPTGQSFRETFPEYYRALHNEPSWQYSQDVQLSRLDEDETVHEHLWLRMLPSGGAYLLVHDQTGEIRGQRERIQTARLAAMGFMLAGVCHEVSNPLSGTLSMLQILQGQEHLTEETMRRGLDSIATNVKRILEISTRINHFSRIGDGIHRPMRVDVAVDEAVALLQTDNRFEDMEVIHEQESEAVICGDVGQLRQVFYNLLLNSAQAMDGKGKVRVRTLLEDRDTVCVVLDDTGPGIPEESLGRIFEPFFTTKHTGYGTGLGLALSRDIVREHEGTLNAGNEPGGGACFEVRFPRRREQSDE